MLGTVSMLQTQRDIIIDTIRNTAVAEWKVLVLDEKSRKILDNVVREDDILNEKITNIEEIEQRRPLNQDMDVIYILTPQSHIVDCLMADLDRRRYRKTYLFWTSILPPHLRQRIDRSNIARQQISIFRVINVEYYPRESHLVTFRDPWSFPTLYHPACTALVKQHIADLAQKIVAICVSLGEYPTIRYYRPRDPLPSHESHVLCTFLAQAVQDEIDVYAKYHQDFPPQSNRPRAALYIVDRSMDLFAPFVHEFTYQAMAHDLLPIRDGEKVTFRTLVNEGRPDQEEKDMEIGEKDKIWVENRHRHMKDTIEKLMGDFQKFMDENPHFADPTNSQSTNLNTIKDMLAYLPQFQELKEAYSLHLSMAQDCMNVFQRQKLSELASLEQSLATGLDEDYKKPKNLADQTVRMLDEEAITPSDRLRLIALYLLYKDGLLSADLYKLRCHASLPSQDEEVLRNLELLGARVTKPLKDQKPPSQRLFPVHQPAANSEEEYALSRFDSALKLMLENHVGGSLDPTLFPYVKPDPSAHDQAGLASSESLRTAKPTWADFKSRVNKPRQRIIVFMAGGATYSEARSCYEISARRNRDVVLVTSHMLTPGLWMRQLGDLSMDRRRLGIPADQPAKKAPAHLFEKEPAPRPTQQPAAPPAPPSKQMAGLSLDGAGAPRPSAPPRQSRLPPRMESPAQSTHSVDSGRSGGKLSREKDKKKHLFFSSKK